MPLPLAVHANTPLDVGSSVAYFGSRVSLLLQFWSDFPAVGWSDRPLSHSCMGKAQRQRRQGSRPGQQNREFSRSNETLDSSLETSPVAVPETPETPSPPSHSLSPREKALFGYVTWSTSKPPPMTIFVRPYLQALARSTSKRAGGSTDGGGVDHEVPVPSPATPPTGVALHHSRAGLWDAASACSWFSNGCGPTWQIPLPRRRGARPTAPTRDIGISLEGEPFLLPKPKKYPLRKPASMATTPVDTPDDDEMKPKTKKQQSASSATTAGSPPDQPRLRKFRTPKTALKFSKKKQESAGPSSHGGDEQKKGKEVSSVNFQKTQRPLGKTQVSTGTSQTEKRLRTTDKKVPLSDSSARVMAAPNLPSTSEWGLRASHQPGDLIESLLSKAPVVSTLAEDSESLTPVPVDVAGRATTPDKTDELPSFSVRKSAVQATLSKKALPDYLYSKDGPPATAKRPRCKGIWFIPEPDESQDDLQTPKGDVSRASSRAYKALMWRSLMCKLWSFSCSYNLTLTISCLRSSNMRSLRLCYGLQLRVKGHRTSTVRRHARGSRLRGRRSISSWCCRRAPWTFLVCSCHKCLHRLLCSYHCVKNHVAGPGPKSGRVVKAVDSVDVWTAILHIARHHWISLVDFSEPRVGCSKHPEFTSSFALTMSFFVRIASEGVEKLGRTISGAAMAAYSYAHLHRISVLFLLSSLTGFIFGGMSPLASLYPLILSPCPVLLIHLAGRVHPLRPVGLRL